MIPIEDIRELCRRDGYSAMKFWEARDRVTAWLDSLNAKPDPDKIAPAAGQIWQRLNNGSKTSSSAPRLTVLAVGDRMVHVRNQRNRVEWKRISTLQRDWYCLNP